MAQHSKYWSCSPFADWIRGTPKGGAKTSEDWDEWRTTAKMRHNFRYWVAEEFLDDIQDFATWPARKINDIRYYINNRWVSHSHALTAHARDIKPGAWCDVGNRFLPCLFNELVDFVEVEQAWHHCCWSDEAKTKFAVPWYCSGWLRWRTWRCPEAGLEYLRWASDLVMNEDMGLEPTDELYGKLTNQAVAAREIVQLYTWWTVTYRNRPDPYEASGWTAYCEASREANGGRLSWSSSKDSAELRKISDKAHKLLRKIEADYEKEDEQMMIRLIKIRNSLWT
jgi:hypothetical protein